MPPINASTRYCAVFGHPVRHSASPAMHNAGLRTLGLNWRYLAFDVRPEALAEALDGARSMHFIGVNLTVPHKLLALDMMDVLDDTAQLWGAVNTVRFEGLDAGGTWLPLADFDDVPPEQVRLHGFNTDADAIIRSLREDLGLTVSGQSILILGAGGAGRVAALRLAAEGVARLYLVNRTKARAEEVAQEVRARHPEVAVALGYPTDSAGERIDLVLNATSLGLKTGDPLPFDAGRFSLKAAAAAYDMIYQPAETPFLMLARNAGCRTSNGLGMLLYQGARALEIWSGVAAPEIAMRDALASHIYGD